MKKPSNWCYAEIEALRGRVTMFIATHRAERLRSADQILHLEGAHLRERVSLRD